MYGCVYLILGIKITKLISIDYFTDFEKFSLNHVIKKGIVAAHDEAGVRFHTWMRDSGRPVVWDRFSLRLMPGYGSVAKVVRRSSTCSLEKLVLFLRLALREEPPLEAADLASSERGETTDSTSRIYNTSFPVYHICIPGQLKT